jgi:hypothetical protein
VTVKRLQQSLISPENACSCGEVLPTFIVNSAILRPAQDPRACAVGAPKMLTRAGVQGVKLRSCYCCSEYGSAVFVVDGDSREVVLDAFNRINVPVASINVVEEIPQQATQSVTA